MQNSLALPNKITTLLQLIEGVTTAKESKKLETLTAGARQMAKEEDDYFAMVQATKAYILARRKTTELLMEEVRSNLQGRPKKVDKDVRLLSSYGFTYKQWNRRVQELRVPKETVYKYFDEILGMEWNPSVSGMMRYNRNGGFDPAKPGAERTEVTTFTVCPHCGGLIEG